MAAHPHRRSALENLRPPHIGGSSSPRRFPIYPRRITPSPFWVFGTSSPPPNLPIKHPNQGPQYWHLASHYHRAHRSQLFSELLPSIICTLGILWVRNSFYDRLHWSQLFSEPLPYLLLVFIPWVYSGSLGTSSPPPHRHFGCASHFNCAHRSQLFSEPSPSLLSILQVYSGCATHFTTVHIGAISSPLASIDIRTKH